MSKKKLRFLIGAGLLTSTLAVGFPAMPSSAANLSLANLPTQDLDVNINIQNNPNINNDVKVENNNTNTNNNENNNANANNNQNNNENTNNNNNEKEKEEKPKPRRSIEGEASISQSNSKDPYKVMVKGWANTSHVKVKIGSHEYSIQLSNPNGSRQSFEKIYTLSSNEKGTLQGYVYAIGNGGKRKQIGQGTVTIKGEIPPPPAPDNKIHDPQGAVESLNYDIKTKKLIITGWALDEDNLNAPVNVQVYVGGDKGTTNARLFPLSANHYHTVKGQHGFNGSLSLPSGFSGEQPVHVYALNLTGTKGTDKKIKTGTILIPPDIPSIDGKGSLSFIGDQKVKVEGWSNTDRIKVKIENFINDAISLSNPNHENKSFEKIYQLPVNVFDSHSYGIEAYNSSATGNIKRIGEGTFTIPRPAHKPTGQFQYLDGIETNKIRVQGWAKDEDAPNSPLRIHIYVGGGAGSNAGSQEIRTDASGRFDATLSVNRIGWQDVYAYAIDNDGRSENPEIGHGKVFIPWLGKATLRHDVYRIRDNGDLYKSKDDKNTGWEKVFVNDLVTVLYEANGYYLIRYHSDTDGYDKERWIEISGGGIVPR